MKKQLKAALKKQSKEHPELIAMANSIHEKELELELLNTKKEGIKAALKSGKKALKKQSKALLKAKKKGVKTAAVAVEESDTTAAPKNGAAVKTGKIAAVQTPIKKLAALGKTARAK